MAKENTFSRYRRTLNRFGISYEEFDQIKAENPSLSNADIVWGLFNKALTLNAGKWKATSNIYFSMAWFLKDTGRDFYRIRKLATDFELRDLKSNIKGSESRYMIEILADPTPCSNCQNLNNKRFSFAEAEQGLPFPAETCTNSRGFCRSILCTVPIEQHEHIPSKSGCLGVIAMMATLLTVTIVTFFVKQS